MASSSGVAGAPAGRGPGIIEITELGPVPRTFPSAEGQQRSQQDTGEAPHHHARHLERRPHVARWVPHLEPVRRVDQLGDRNPCHGGGLRRVDRRHRRRCAPVCQYRCDAESGRWDEQLGQQARAAAPRPAAAPVSSAASRSAVATGSASPGSAPPPGKDTCPAWSRRPAARSVSSTSGPCGVPPEEDQHGRGPAAVRRRRQAVPGERLGVQPARRDDQRHQPVRNVAQIDQRPAQPPPPAGRAPVYRATAAATSSADRSGTGGSISATLPSGRTT